MLYPCSLNQWHAAYGRTCREPGRFIHARVRHDISYFLTKLEVPHHLTIRERREHRIYKTILQSVPGLEDRLMEGSEEEVGHVAELVRQ
jgi:hypothetical protein